MCGIVGAIAKRDILDILLAGLHSLEYRGYDSAGLAVINEGKLHTIKTPGKVFELEKAIQDEHFNDQGNIGIAHTRWATHGEPTKENAHPQISGTIAVVHNGIIENYRPLKEKLQALGYEFKSTTDTEVLAHLIANYRKQTNSLEEAVRLALKDVTGSYAIAVIDANEPDVIVGAKNHSPLVIGIGIGENFLASDVLALLPVTSRFIYLDDGELCVVKRKNVEVFNQEGHRLVKHSTICTEGVETISKGKYRHFMEKEIFEQPQALFNTCLGRLNASGVENEAFHGLKLENLKRVIIDHHSSGTPFADEGMSYIVPASPSTTMLVDIVREELGVPLDKETAGFLYRGFATDTGFYHFLSAEAAASCLPRVASFTAAGVSPYEIYDEMHDGRKLSDIKDTASITLNSEPVLNGALIICHQEATMMNARLSDGVYASLLETEGVKAVVLIKEREGGMEIGFRSKNNSGIDVGKIAAGFGGGGHAKAAGATIQGITFEEARSLIIARFEEII